MNASGKTLVSLSLLFCVANAQSQTLTVAGGRTIRTSSTEHDAYRLELGFSWNPELWRKDRWDLSLNHALSVMSFRDRNNVNAVSWAPNFVLARETDSGLQPYIQLGLGVAYLSDDKFESEPKSHPMYILEGTTDMGSHWQFESSFALGLRMDRFSIRAKVYHYSNAELADENDGMDVAELGLSYSF